jgi:hypothetical protein
MEEERNILQDENTVRDYCDRIIEGSISATAVSASSDDRLKFNEQSITNGLAVINQLEPKIYDKSDILNIEKNTHREAGLIAQEVLNTDLAFSVTGGDHNDIFGNMIEQPYRVNYNDVVAYLIASVKELDTLVKSQETKVTALEAENTLLKSKLNEILTELGKETI